MAVVGIRRLLGTHRRAVAWLLVEALRPGGCSAAEGRRTRALAVTPVPEGAWVPEAR